MDTDSKIFIPNIFDITKKLSQVLKILNITNEAISNIALLSITEL